MTYPLYFCRKLFSIQTDQSLTFLETSILFNISMATLCRWSKKIEPNMTRHKPATRCDMDALKSDIQTDTNAYQYEQTQRWDGQ